MKISLTIEAGSIEHAYADSSRINSTTAQRWKVESLVARKRLELDKVFSGRARTLSAGQPCNGCDFAELFVKSRRNLSTRKSDTFHPFPRLCSVVTMTVYWPKEISIWLFFFFCEINLENQPSNNIECKNSSKYS